MLTGTRKSPLPCSVRKLLSKTGPDPADRVASYGTVTRNPPQFHSMTRNPPLPWFPQKDLVDAFFVLGMRGINIGNQDSAQEFGNAEVNQLAQHFGEEKIHKGTVGLPKVSKPAVVQQWMRAKDIVRSMKYPVDNFPELWQLLAKHHLEELDQIIRIAQIGLILPLHTADCERTFSQQNKILTKNRARLSSQHLDELIRVRLFSKAGQSVNEQRVLAVWKATKARKLYC